MCLEKTELLVKIAQTLYDKSFDHGLLHVERVLNWVFKITEHENLNLNKDILLLTVYLHDVGRLIGEPHAYYSALIAEYLLEEIACPGELKFEILNAIIAHSYSYVNVKGISPRSDLGRVLSDADKLDALGVVGFLRVFMYGEREQRDLVFSIRHFYEKIFRLKQLLHYEYSKRVAGELTMKTSRILNELIRELNKAYFESI